MANTKSAKKQARMNVKRRARNVARHSDVKTACKKVLDAIENKQIDLAKELMRSAESKLARANIKGLLKKGTASRKVSRLAKKVSAIARTEQQEK